MSKIFTNKKIWKILVVTILVIMTAQIIIPCNYVFADPSDTTESEKSEDNVQDGGVLVGPLASLGTALGDGAVSILHKYIMGQEVSRIHVTESNDDSLLGTILFNARKVVGFTTGFVGGAVKFVAGDNIISSALLKISEFSMPNDLYLPVYTYTPEEIFKGNILLFNVNFFDNKSDIMVNYSKKVENGYEEVTDEEPKTKEQYEKEFEDGIKDGTLQADSWKINYYYYFKDGDTNNIAEDNIVKTSPQDSARILLKPVSQWYIALRNICIVIMLSVLVYIGIRMMLTSIASDKAKYKEMLKDWFVGLCLLFILHYIMAFSNVLVEKFTELITSTQSDDIVSVPLKDEYGGNLKQAVTEMGLGDEYWKGDTLYYPTNLMGRLRLELQFSDGGMEWLGLVACFIGLIAITVIFTFTYFKRLIYMAFLTIIAPFVALTYCIDKTNDGQAQGFNMWLKEYIFNLLLQPLHLLLYFILVTSVFDLAKENILYSLIALFFMTHAEKFMRKLFGFEKAMTPPNLLGATAGAQMAMGAFNRLAGRGHHGESKDKGIRTNKQSEREELGAGDGTDATHAFAGMLGEAQSGEDSSSTSNSENDGDATSSARQSWLDAQSEAERQQQLSEEFYDRRLDGESFDDWMQREHSELVDNEPIRTVDNAGELDEATDAEPQTQSEAQQEGEQGEQQEQQPRLVSRERNLDLFRQRASRVGRKIAPKLKRAAISGARTLARGTLAGTGALVAGAVTAASGGNLGNTMQAMAAGAATGSAVASRGMNTASRLSSEVVNNVQELKDAWYGEDPAYKERQEQRRIKEFKKDKDLRNALSQEFGEERMKEMMDSGEVDTYYKYGARDAKDIVALGKTKEKIQQEFGISEQSAIEAAGGTFQFDRDYGNIKDGKKREAAIQHEASSRVGEERGKEIAKFASRGMQIFNDAKHGRI